MNKTKQILQLKDLIPILEILGIEIEGQYFYELKIQAKVNDPVQVIIKRYVMCDAGKLKKVCENYELVKKEQNE